MKRAKHSLSHYRMVTADMGELFPIACVPVLPGDTVQHSTSALVRVSPLNTPVMHPVAVRVHHFFAPNRILWPKDENGGWEDFITGGNNGANAQKPPTVSQTADKKSALSYLGIPPINGAIVNALPLRAMNMIFNEYYRDQDLMTARLEDDNTLPRCAWEKDYFSTARPWSQRGPEVTLPIGDKAPVSAGNSVVSGDRVTVNHPSGNGFHVQSITGITGATEYAPTVEGYNLEADLSQATGVNINDVRASFAVQRYQEARARYGARFTEYLRYCGITPSDARLQRPEFLGGGTTRLNFSEVLQTAPNNPGTDQNGIGDLYGHGIAGVRSNAYRKFFEEHGYIISFMSVRPKSIYMNGVPREFLKTNKEDYFQKELASLGQQEVSEAELFANNTPGTFGFQDRYHEYRSQPSQVSQDFRDTLNSWHLARELASDVTLNEEFIECNPSKRIYQVQSTDALWIMCNHKMVARRMVPKRANPRVL